MITIVLVLIMTSTTFACMSDSQCIQAQECCYLNVCTPYRSDGCQGTRLQAFQWTKARRREKLEINNLQYNSVIHDCKDSYGIGCPDILKAIYDAGYPTGKSKSAISLVEILHPNDQDKQDSKITPINTSVIVFALGGIVYYATKFLRAAKDQGEADFQRIV